MMKRIFAFLVFLSLCFAATTAAAKITDGLSQLCGTVKSVLALLVFLFLIFGGFPILIGGALYIFKKEDKTLKKAGMVLLAIGGICVVLCILSVILYVLAPALVQSMVGGGAEVRC